MKHPARGPGWRAALLAALAAGVAAGVAAPTAAPPAAAAAAVPQAVALTTPQPLPYGGPPYVAPNPYVVWIDRAVLPTTTPPLFSQCHGCDCVQLFAEDFAAGGQVAARYRCAAAPNAVPAIRWTGFDDAAGISFAVTVVDLDEPNGSGAVDNRVSPRFWAANIPADWRALDEAKLAADGDGVIVGRNRRGALAMEPICPGRGRHRVGLTLWVLRSSLPGLAADTPYAELAEQLAAAELARATVFAEAAAVPEVLLELATEHPGLRRLRRRR